MLIKLLRWLGGPAQKNVIFQMVQIPLLSVPICSSRCEYIILKVQNKTPVICLLDGSNVTFGFWVGFTISEIFVDF